MTIIDHLKELKNENISDIFLTEGKSPKVRRNSQLEDFKKESISRESLTDFFEKYLPAGTWEKLKLELDLDLGFSLSPTERYRLNIGFDQGAISIVARKVSSGAINFKDLNLPEVF